MLTDEEKVEAVALGLTYTEMNVALRTRIAPETYAARKRELQAERDAWDAKMQQLAEAVTDRLQYAVRGRGQPLPPAEDTDQA
jgi:hypothetical protein